MNSMSAQKTDFDPKFYKLAKNENKEQMVMKQIEKDLLKLKETMLQEEMQRDRREVPTTAEDQER